MSGDDNSNQRKFDSGATSCHGKTLEYDSDDRVSRCHSLDLSSLGIGIWETKTVNGKDYCLEETP